MSWQEDVEKYKNKIAKVENKANKKLRQKMQQACYHDWVVIEARPYVNEQLEVCDLCGMSCVTDYMDK